MNKELVIRLLKYRRILTQLKSLGFDRVFSNNLGDAIGVAPALVRKDFSLLLLGGNKRGGYNIDYLAQQLDSILGKTHEQKIIILGMGKIGSALAQYRGFRQGDFEVAAGFDLNAKEITPECPCPVYEVSRLPSFVEEKHIEVAVLAVPEENSADSFKLLKEAGIKGILNFTPLELKSSAQCLVHNINIGVEIENLFFQVVKNGMAGLDLTEDELYQED
ncbi:MAG: redox-sensing transcriptional repressor Rex [Spirochaetes bacterium GWB1_48_6]|nr:MAG: redox-sensing transcriptional repressor Rex [Spirochaetes bacterium GWB1_48_6]